MAAAIPGQAMAAMVDTAQHLPATAVPIARPATVEVGRLRLMVEVVGDARMAAVAVDARTAVEVVDMRVVAAEAIRVVVVTPAAATANDRDEELDVSDKLCH